MDLFDVLNLIGGLSLFLFGMTLMGQALERSAGNKLKALLGRMTTNRFTGLLTGLGVTAIIQSSSATTVMVVGFVNSGIMKFAQTWYVIFGANIGTTLTAWILALSGLDGKDNIVLTMMKPENFSPILALIGILMLMGSKIDKKKSIGTILIGFAVLMYGMEFMKDAVAPLTEMEGFGELLVKFNNPIVGVVVGSLFTALIQSSSAATGVVITMVGTGVLPLELALFIVLGANIGTCVTAMISSISAGKNGKRAALIHLYFNVIGVVFWLLMYYLVGWLLDLSGVFDLFGLANGTMIDTWGIAAVHTVFKILSVVLIAPFSRLLEKLACLGKITE